MRLSEARVAEETVEKPRRVKMKSRIEEMIKMDVRGKPPYDTSPYDTVTVKIEMSAGEAEGEVVTV
ncbi:hypothetical protein EJB05_06850, partial [Eragrostis curvula]